MPKYIALLSLINTIIMCLEASRYYLFDLKHILESDLCALNLIQSERNYTDHESICHAQGDLLHIQDVRVTFLRIEVQILTSYFEKKNYDNHDT